MEDCANSTSEVDFGHGLRRKSGVCGFVVSTRGSRDGDQRAHPTLAGECRKLLRGWNKRTLPSFCLVQSANIITVGNWVSSGWFWTSRGSPLGYLSLGFSLLLCTHSLLPLRRQSKPSVRDMQEVMTRPGISVSGPQENYVGWEYPSRKYYKVCLWANGEWTWRANGMDPWVAFLHGLLQAPLCIWTSLVPWTKTVMCLKCMTCLRIHEAVVIYE